MEPSSILIASGVLLVLALCWFGLHYWANPPLKMPDAEARVTGNCGDTMELCFNIVNGKVSKVRHWSNGCAISQQCIESAAILTRGKSPEQLMTITMLDILEMVGHLPNTHLHCAQLAETTLQQAVNDYSAHLDNHDPK